MSFWYACNLKSIIFQFQDVSEIERDQLLCAGYKGFMQPKDARQNVEIKANWSRARKQYGPSATDITVSANKNPHVDVSIYRDIINFI